MSMCVRLLHKTPDHQSTITAKIYQNQNNHTVTNTQIFWYITLKSIIPAHKKLSNKRNNVQVVSIKIFAGTIYMKDE